MKCIEKKSNILVFTVNDDISISRFFWCAKFVGSLIQLLYNLWKKELKDTHMCSPKNIHLFPKFTATLTAADREKVRISSQFFRDIFTSGEIHIQTSFVTLGYRKDIFLLDILGLISFLTNQCCLNGEKTKFNFHYMKTLISTIFNRGSHIHFKFESNDTL